MARLVLSINVSLDGCCDHRITVADDEHHRYVTELLSGASALLLGRGTYDLFEGHWPAVARDGSGTPDEVAFARVLESKPKYVASRRPVAPGWAGVTRLAGDLAREVPALKQTLDGEIVVFGSPGLARSLAELGQLDELHLAVQPVVAGHGPRLFDGLRARLPLAHQETRTFRSGVALGRYLPATPA